MTEPEPQRVRRIRKRRRSRDPGSGWRRRVVGGLAGLGLFLALAVGFWVYRSGCRGPRFLERWPEPAAQFEPWQELEPGIESTRAFLDVPRLVRAHALRVDLSRPDLEVVVPRARYVSGGDSEADWPLRWLREHRLRAAINATPFNPAPILPERPTRLMSLAISNGERWSDPSGNLDNLVVTADGMVRLMAARIPVGDAREAAGGFLIIRRNDRNLGEKSVLDAATVIGISEDRRWLILLAVDGGQPGYSDGVTPQEASELIGRLGASDALRMDGGASTALAVASGGGLRGGRVLNRPRNPVYNGAPRPVGNVVGIRRKAPARD